jgi:hypothetical protein
MSGLTVSVKISFDDPLSGERIATAARGTNCSHAAVFDKQVTKNSKKIFSFSHFFPDIFEIYARFANVVLLEVEVSFVFKHNHSKCNSVWLEIDLF